MSSNESCGAAVRMAARVADGERMLPTTLGGPAVWARVIAAAADGGRAEPHAVVMVRTDVGSEGHAERTAAALRRSLRDDDVVCLLTPGTYAVLVLACPHDRATELADRLVAALLDVGVGAAAGVATEADPRRAQDAAHTRAEVAWTARRTLRP